MPGPNDPPVPPVINGARGAFAQPGSWGRSESGPFWRYIYDGTRTEIEALAPQFESIGATYEITRRHGGLASIEARIAFLPNGGTETPEVLWELDPAEVEKDLLESDFGGTSGTLAALSAKDRVIVKQGLEKDVDPGALPSEFADADDVATVISFYRLMKAGVRAYPIEASVIRRTQIVSNQWAVKASFTNVGRILSTASFYALESVPSDLLFDVPTTPSPTQYIETAGDLQYGWRKVRPRISTLAQQKRQIVNHWQLGLWAVAMHGAVL